MRRPEFIARQSRCPTGLLGWVIAMVMASETAGENDAAIVALHIAPNDRVLELGCGHGRTLARIAAIAAGGVVVGIDLSEDMVAMATRRCAAFVRTGRVEVRHGDGLVLPYPDAAFEKALAVHTLYFWTEPSAQLREIRRVLVPGGRLVLGFRSAVDRAVADFPAAIYRFYSEDQVVELLEGAGYAGVTVRSATNGRDAGNTEQTDSGGVVLATATATAQ